MAFDDRDAKAMVGCGLLLWWATKALIAALLILILLKAIF